MCHALLTPAKDDHEMGEVVNLMQIKECILTAKEYILGLSIETERKSIMEKDVKRAAELSAYFSHCNLEPAHVQLSVQSAMMTNFRLKNFATAQNFAERLLRLNPSPKAAQAVRESNKGAKDYTEWRTESRRCSCTPIRSV